MGPNTEAEGWQPGVKVEERADHARTTWVAAVSVPASLKPDLPTQPHHTKQTLSFLLYALSVLYFFSTCTPLDTNSALLNALTS